MIRKIMIASTGFALLVSLFVAPSIYGLSQEAWWDDLSENVNLLNVVVSPPYGYHTHGYGPNTEPDDDTKFDSRSAHRWATTVLNKSYKVNIAGIDGIADATALQRIQEADNLWYNSLIASSSLPSFTYVTGTPQTQVCLRLNAVAQVQTAYLKLTSVRSVLPPLPSLPCRW